MVEIWRNKVVKKFYLSLYLNLGKSLSKIIWILLLYIYVTAALSVSSMALLIKQLWLMLQNVYHISSRFIVISVVYPYEDAMRDVNLVDKGWAVATFENLSTCDQKLIESTMEITLFWTRQFILTLKSLLQSPLEWAQQEGASTPMWWWESWAIEIWGSKMMCEFMPCKNNNALFFLDKTIITHLKNPRPIDIEINEVGGGSVWV